MPTPSPLVSVCMPLYNTERFIAAAIEGVLAQTHTNLELIVCDNCSTDRSVEIVEAFVKQDPRVRLVRNARNIGFAGNVHKVLSQANGDLMMLHCADDTAEPQALERVVRAYSELGQPKFGVFYTDAYVTDAENKPVSVITREPTGFVNADIPLANYYPSQSVERFSGRDALAYALPRLQTVGWIGSAVYTKALFDSIDGVYNGMTHSPDKHLMYNLLSRDPVIGWVREPLFRWRQHESNQTSQNLAEAVPKRTLDAYGYTFEYPQAFLESLGTSREALARRYVDFFCLRTALDEIRQGRRLAAFKLISLALAGYPKLAARNPKLYAALLGCALGPLGTGLATLAYRMGWGRLPAVRLPEAAGTPSTACTPSGSRA